MNRAFHVRRLRLPELDAILYVERACFGEDAYDRNLFAKYLAMEGVLFLVAERAAKISGYCLAVQAGDRAEIVSIAVAPRARRQGAAQMLLASTLRRLKRRGVVRVSLTVKAGNHAARALYERHGFIKVRTVRAYYEDGADGLRMYRDSG